MLLNRTWTNDCQSSLNLSLKNMISLVRLFLDYFLFLVACTRLYNPLCPSVGWSVGRSVGRSHFTFFYDFISLTSLLLPKWSGDLKYGPCPPARDFGSRVSGLVQLGFGNSNECKLT